MPIIDLTREYISEFGPVEHSVEQVKLDSGLIKYTGLVWHYQCDSMTGSYLDFPGHILETDDGQRADNVDPALFFNVPTTVLHLDKASGSGAVTAEELRYANGGSDKSLPFLAINALGRKNPHDVEWRSVFLDDSAVDWIIGSGCRLLFSDVYESQELAGVFLKLFKAGITTACEPVNLWKVTGENVFMTILFPKWPSAQIPARIIASF